MHGICCKNLFMWWSVLGSSLTTAVQNAEGINNVAIGKSWSLQYLGCLWPSYSRFTQLWIAMRIWIRMPWSPGFLPCAKGAWQTMEGRSLSSVLCVNVFLDLRFCIACFGIKYLFSAINHEFFNELTILMVIFNGFSMNSLFSGQWHELGGQLGGVRHWRCRHCDWVMNCNNKYVLWCKNIIKHPYLVWFCVFFWTTWKNWGAPTLWLWWKIASPFFKTAVSWRDPIAVQLASMW